MKNVLIIILLVFLAVIGYRYLAPTISNKVAVTDNQETSDEDVVTLCYQYKGLAEGMKDNRELSLNINGMTVTGTKSGYNGSDEYSVGYEGTIEGELDRLGGDTINTITTLTLSGDGEIRQEERYMLSENSITEMRYGLREDFDANILRIDETVAEAAEGQTFPIEYQYEKVDCSSVNNNQDNHAPEEVVPSSYLCFKADEEDYGSFDKVMFALDDSERAKYAQYENNGELRTVNLSFVSKDIPNQGFSTYTLTMMPYLKMAASMVDIFKLIQVPMII